MVPTVGDDRLADELLPGSAALSKSGYRFFVVATNLVSAPCGTATIATPRVTTP